MKTTLIQYSKICEELVPELSEVYIFNALETFIIPCFIEKNQILCPTASLNYNLLI